MKWRLAGFEFRIGRSADPSPSPPPAPADPTAPVPPWESIFLGLDQGLLAVDRKKRILFCNQGTEPLLNRSWKEAAGLPLWEALRHRDVLDLVDQVLRDGREQSREIPLPGPAEAVWQVRGRALLKDGRPDGAVLAFNDLSRVRRLENLRKDFVANVSHELRTPLTALRAALETLLEGALDDREHAREFLQTAQNQVDRLQRLIDDLLVLSRLEKQKPLAGVRTPLRAAAEKVLRSLEPMAVKSRVALKTDWPAGDADVPLSEDELAQVLMNLLDNAIKYNRPDGQVVLSARREGGGLVLSVKDTGMGIPARDLPRIFERFYRVDKGRSRDLGGTGLGLSIVKNIVESRGGTVRAESAPGRGSEFSVAFPA